MHEKFTVFEKHPDYVRMLPVWNYLKDLYEGSDSWLDISPNGYKPTSKTQVYIPRHTAESFENWVARINATYYDDPFAAALYRFTDFLFRSPPLVQGDCPEFRSDIDLLTSDGQTFSALALGVSLSVMLYGRSFILVDFPSENSSNYRDFLDNGRPYWVEIKPQQLINWSISTIRGRQLFDFVAIEENFYEFSDTNYSHVLVKQLRILRPGMWELWRQDDDGNDFQIQSGVTALDFIPLVPCFGRSVNLSDAQPFFKSLADKNRTLYQITSDHLRKVSLCCNPTPVLKDQMRSQKDDLEIGPNSFIMLNDPSGSFTWEEPAAGSIEQSRRTIDDLQASINFDIAKFLEIPTPRQNASVTNIMTSPLEASLETFAIFLSRSLEKAIQFHEAYFGNTVNPQVIFQVDIFPDTAKDSQTAFALSAFYKEGLISRATALKGIYELGILPQDFDLDLELQLHSEGTIDG
jgi:hypothetical protein